MSEAAQFWGRREGWSSGPLRIPKTLAEVAEWHEEQAATALRDAEGQDWVATHGATERDRHRGETRAASALRRRTFHTEIARLLNEKAPPETEGASLVDQD